MTDSKILHVPDYSAPVPRLYVTSLPIAEQNAGDLINGQLAELTSFVDDFGAALELFDFSSAGAGHPFQPSTSAEDTRKRDVMRRWKFMAAKDGAMSLYHFGETLDAIRGGLGDCKTLREMVDTDKLKVADKHFDKAFPNYVKLRHAVAHQTIVARAPFSALKRSDGSGQIIITGSMVDRRFTSVWNGHRVEYDISEASLRELAAVRDRVYAAFNEAVVCLRQMRQSKDP